MSNPEGVGFDPAEGGETSEKSISELMEDEAALREYNVVVFGTSSAKTPQDQAGISSARQIGKMVTGELGMSVGTGGYDVGAMKAAADGAKDGLADRGMSDRVADYIHSTPMTEDVLPGFPVVEGASTERHSTLSDRLAALLKSGDAFVAVAGGSGTVSELMTAANEEGLYAAFNRPDSLPSTRPIIVADPTLRHTDSMRAIARINGEKAKAIEKLGITYVVNDDTEVVKGILETYYLLAHRDSLGADEQEQLDQRLKELEKYKLTNFLDEKKLNEDGGGI